MRIILLLFSLSICYPQGCDEYYGGSGASVFIPNLNNSDNIQTYFRIVNEYDLAPMLLYLEINSEINYNYNTDDTLDSLIYLNPSLYVYELLDTINYFPLEADTIQTGDISNDSLNILLELPGLIYDSLSSVIILPKYIIDNFDLVHNEEPSSGNNWTQWFAGIQFKFEANYGQFVDGDNWLVYIFPCGCSDPIACNYIPDAIESGFCIYPEDYGWCDCQSYITQCYTEECSDGFTRLIDGMCYYQSDIDVLQDIIDLNDYLQGQDPLENDLLLQIWENGQLEHIFFSFQDVITILPESVCEISAELNFMDNNRSKICPPYPVCIVEEYLDIIDTSECCDGQGLLDNTCDCDGNVMDECGICGGNGIPDGACDCNGSVFDCAGECSDGFTRLTDGMCYYQSDLDALQDIIDLNGLNEETSGNDMDNGDGIFEPIELGGQLWFNNRLSRLTFYDNDYNIKYNYEISVIPESIGNLNELIYLDLDNNQIENLPDEFINLNLLETLWLGGGNPLNTIPTEIFQLLNLTTLGIYQSGISEVPPEIGNLTNLETLSLSRNQLTSLPESIGNLTNLETLNLSRNQLTSLPESICNIPESYNFDFSNNDICSIPSCMYWINDQYCEEINCPDDLTELNGDCYFQGDVDVWQNMCDLNDLDCNSDNVKWNNGRLTSLFHYLIYPELNQLTTLPENIGNLSNLKKLSLSNNQLTTLPESVGNLSNLEYLYLSSNQLATLPESVCNLSIDWGGTYGGFDDSSYYFSIDNNNLCPPYPECIKDYVGEQDTTNCPIFGCTEESACNYDSTATEGDDSCEYPEDFEWCDCDGNEPTEGFDCDGEPLSLFNGLIPEDFSIHSIYPNPFNPVTSITYGLPEHVNVQIIVYDLSGKQVETLINEFQAPGYHSVNWNADSHPSGVYFVKMHAGNYISIQKLMLVK